MGYKDDSNKRYIVYGSDNDPIDGLLVESADESSNLFRADKDGVETGNGEKLVNSNGKSTTEHVKDTQSGDGNTSVFTVSHNFSSAPSYAQVTPASADANGDYHVSDLTADHVEITYGTDPVNGTDNLTWHVLVRE
jgi:hypothetical protein